MNIDTIRVMIEALNLKRSTLTDSSVQRYVGVINRYVKKNEMKIQNIENIFNDFEQIEKYIDEGATNSSKSKATAFVVVADAVGVAGETLEKLRQIQEKYKLKSIDETKKDNMTPSQRENWVSHEELLDAIDKIGFIAKQKGFWRRKQVEEKPNNLFLQYVLAVLSVNYPTRNEVGNFRVATNENRLNDKLNYLIVKKSGKMFIRLNRYKTSKKYGAISIEIDKNEVKKIIRHYLKYHRTGEFLFGEELSSPDVTKNLQKIFLRVIGKKISSGLIRSIIATKLLENFPTVDQIRQQNNTQINILQHSLNVSNAVYRNVNEKKNAERKYNFQ